MAEIGLIASIVGVASTGSKISITLFQLASAFGSAASEVRFVAADTSALALVLTNLGNTLRTRESKDSDGEQIAGAVVLLCRSVMDDSQELIRLLEPLIQASGTPSQKALLRVRWLFEKSKFATHRQALESLKSTLNLLIATMAFAASVESKAPEAQSESLREEVENLKAATQANKQGNRDILLMLQNSNLDSSRHIQEGLDPTVQEDEFPRGPTSVERNQLLGQVPVSSNGNSHADVESNAPLARASNSNIEGLISLIEISQFQRRVAQYADRVLENPTGSISDHASGARSAEADSQRQEADFQLHLEQQMRQAELETQLRRRETEDRNNARIREAEIEARIKRDEAEARHKEMLRQAEIEAQIRGTQLQLRKAELDMEARTTKVKDQKKSNLFKRMFSG